ncbi:DUF4194 domain-containing protein [Anaeromyxobacter sp. Red801]|uniref:DUF4194 domain-containing protein n=1 Tax=Anaeromyxobacter sp. Red801 TaxID=3411632 RepID=UPI003BA18572
MPVTTAPTPIDPLPAVVVALMKGIVDAEADPALWQSLLAVQLRARDYVRVLGLELVVDDAERYAFLRQRPVEDEETPLPRLVARRALGYSVSLLLVLLRKKLAELDAAGGETRLILTRAEIADLVKLFHPERTNEARALDRIDADIAKILDLGFLRRLRSQEDRYEVRRLLKSFVDAQWLDSFDQKLAEYRDHAGLARDAEPKEAR